MSIFGRAERKEVDERGRVFEWSREKHLWIYLFGFLIFSALIHGAGFYLFKVVYPPVVRQDKHPGSIQVLDSSDQATRALLRQLTDRSIYLQPPSARSDVRMRIDPSLIHFSPAFRQFDLELVRPPSELPGPGLPEPLAPIEAPESEGKIILGDGLKDRVIAPWSLLEDFITSAKDVPKIRCEIEVATDGSVKVLSLEGDLNQEEKADLSAAITSTLRFLPTKQLARGWFETDRK